MRKQHGIYVLLVVGIFVLLLVGCGTTPQASGKQNEPGQQAVQEQPAGDSPTETQQTETEEGL